MRKFCLFLALCLMLGSLSGCAGQGETTETTLPEKTTGDAAPIPSETEEPVVIGYDITLAVDFRAIVAEDDRTIYRSPNEGDDSTILIRTQPRDESVLTLDEAGFTATVADGQTCSDLTLETVQVDGFPALRACFTVSDGETFSDIMEYHVVASENYLFRFTDCTGGSWQEGFVRSAETINLLMEDEGVELDYSDLKEFDLGCGVSICAQDTLAAHDAEGFTACLGNQNAIILVMQDKKVENNLTDMDLYDYAELVSEANDLTGFAQDHYGTLQNSFYSSDELGMKYYNLLTVYETEDSFWVFQMTCSAANQAVYALEFSRWATSIAPTGQD